MAVAKKKTSEEEARAQDRRGEKDDGEEDGHASPSQDRQKEIVLQEARGIVPAPSLFPFKTISYSGAHGP